MKRAAFRAGAAGIWNGAAQRGTPRAKDAKSDAAVAAPAEFQAFWLRSLSAADAAELGGGYCHVRNVDTKTLISSAVFSHSRYPDQEGLHDRILERDIFEDFAPCMFPRPYTGDSTGNDRLETAVESIE